MAQFVLLEHDHPTIHWDFMLEEDGVLKTWRLNAQPSSTNTQIEALQLPDHRLAYLDYEGPVSRNRGVVKRIDRGTYHSNDSVIDEHRSENQTVELQLAGRSVIGHVQLRQIADGSEWIFDWAPARDSGD